MAVAVLLTAVAVIAVVSVGSWTDSSDSEGVTKDWTGSGTSGDPWVFGNSKFTAVLDEDGQLTITGSGVMPNFTNDDDYIPWGQSKSKIITVKLDDRITKIGDYNFWLCTSLTKVDLPDGVTGVGDWGFGSCSALKEVVLPAGFLSFGDSAFRNCSSLTEINIPEGVRTITNRSFFYSGLIKIELPDSVTTIGNGALYINSLKEIVFGSGLQSIYWQNPLAQQFYDVDGSGPLERTAENLKDSTFRYSDEKGGMVRVPKHPVTYDSDEGVGDVPIQSDVTEGRSFTVQDYTGTKEGYSFDGWSWNDTVYKAGDSIEMAESAITLTAVWKDTMPRYTVTFKPNGGDWSAPLVTSCRSGEMIEPASIASPTRESYSFSGWSCDGVLYSAGQKVVVLKDMTFTAQWEADGDSDPDVPTTIIPIFPGDEQEPIEVIKDDGKDGSKSNENTVLIIGIVVAIIAILAVMSVSKRE